MLRVDFFSSINILVEPAQLVVLFAERVFKCINCSLLFINGYMIFQI